MTTNLKCSWCTEWKENEAEWMEESEQTQLKQGKTRKHWKKMNDKILNSHKLPPYDSVSYPEVELHFKETNDI